MEKLIELLNEYGNEICNHWGDYQTDMDFTDRDIYWYLSKKFWFIKWLVENDKIDRERINDRWWDMSIHFTDEQLFIMSLSISDTPIDFLCEILK